MLEEPSLKSRIIVTAEVVLIFVYFFVFAYIMPVKYYIFTGTPEPLDVAFHYFFMPLMFSALPVMFLYFSRYRVAYSFDLFDELGSLISARYHLFYGVNAVALLMVVILPLLAPMMAILAGIVIIGRIYYASEALQKGSPSIKFLYISFTVMFLVFIPIVFAIYYYIINSDALLSIISWTWSGWLANLEFLYVLSLSVVSALSICSAISFYYIGTAEFERRTMGVIFTETPKWIHYLGIILTAVFLILTLPPLTLPDGHVYVSLGYSWLMKDIISKIALAITVVLFFFSMLFGIKKKESSTRESLLSLLFMIIFLGIDYYRSTFATIDVVSLILGAAGGVYIILMIACYIKAGEYVE